MPQSIPWVRVVLPAPRSPVSRNMSPGLACSPRIRPRSWVSSAHADSIWTGVGDNGGAHQMRCMYYSRHPMKALVVSDIHSNLEALTAVIDDAGRNGGFDEVWALGDLVGYGPDPSACIELLRQHGARSVAGNHDLAASGMMGVEMFNDYAAAAAMWTTGQLDESDAAYLRDLPLKMEMHGFTAVHGSPRDPVWEYVVNSSSALAAFEDIGTPRCLVGHSHVPFICRLERCARVPPSDYWPGGVGRRPGNRQPRQRRATPRRRPKGQLRSIRLRRGDHHPPPRRVRHTGDPAQDARPRPAPLPRRAANLRPLTRIPRQVAELMRQRVAPPIDTQAILPLSGLQHPSRR